MDAFRKAVAKPSVQETWLKLGIQPVGLATAAIAAWLQDDLLKWTEVVEGAAIKLD
jgi:tripartite-type tricarboxylate transporter receptor subunit TctC